MEEKRLRGEGGIDKEYKVKDTQHIKKGDVEGRS